MKRKQQNIVDHQRNLHLLKCFTSSKHKCRYVCKTDNANIEVIASLLHSFLKNKLNIRNISKIIKILRPIRHLIRMLADKKIKTQQKRKILLHFAIRVILYPILQKKLIPSYAKIINNNNM